ncbi:hypothetical protein [Roseateles sp. P5_E7]
MTSLFGPQRVMAPAPRRRVVAASAVCLGHVLLLLAVWQSRQAATGEVEALRSVLILLPAERRDRAASKAAPQLPARRPVDVPSLRSEPAPPAETIPGVAVAAVPGDAAEPGQGATGIAMPGLAASGPSALMLKPQRDVMLGALSNPAVTDPRSNSPKPTFEERFAMGLDPELCVKLERLPDGSIRRSMGRMVRAQSAIQNSHGAGPHGIKVCS